MKNFIVLLFAVLAPFASSYSQEGPGIYVDPATIDFRLLNNQSASSQILITNKMNIPKQFSIYLNDWQRDTVGGHIYQQPGTNSRSCSNWITLDKQFVELMPGQSMPINVKLSIPDSAEAMKQMRWAMIFIETVEEKKVPSKNKGLQTSIQTNYRVGVHVYQTPPTQINKEVRMVSFEPLQHISNAYRIECKNVGDVQLKCTSIVELLNMENGQKVSLPASEFPLFPEQLRFVDINLPGDITKGKYTLTAMVDAGEDVPLEAVQKVIEIN